MRVTTCTIHNRPDDDTLADAEREAMVRPSPCSMWDDRLYTTHAPVLSWAENGDDLLSESNYRTVLADLQGVAVHDDSEDDVIDASISDWLVGPLRQIFVRVRIGDRPDDCRGPIGSPCPELTRRDGEDDCECGEPDAGDFTNAWARAVEIAMALQDYPVFDESDFSELEYAAYEADLSDALEHAVRSYPDDTTEQAAAIEEMFYADMNLTGGADGDYYHGGDGYHTADWNAVADGYRAIRDDYFEALAVEYGTETEHGVVFDALERFARAMTGQMTFDA